MSGKLWLQMATDVGGGGEEGTLTLTLHILEGQKAKADMAGVVPATALKGRSSLSTVRPPFLKVPQPPKSVPPAEKQVFQHRSLRKTFQKLNHNTGKETKECGVEETKLQKKPQKMKIKMTVTKAIC